MRWNIFTFWRRREDPPEPTPEQEILEELRALKKLSRKQGLLLEKLREEWIEQSTCELTLEFAPLLTFADAFFYLARTFQGSGELSPERRQSFDMVWRTLDALLEAAELRMIREPGVAFDARLHEAVANRSPQGLRLQVLDLIQPGYAHNGRVLKAARVVVGVPIPEMLELNDNEPTRVKESEADAADPVWD